MPVSERMQKLIKAAKLALARKKAQIQYSYVVLHYGQAGTGALSPAPPLSR